MSYSRVSSRIVPSRKFKLINIKWLCKHLKRADGLVAKAHANRQEVSYETGERLLECLPGRLHSLVDLILGGKMNTNDVAYAVAALIDSIESAPAKSGSSSSSRHSATIEV